MTLKEAKEALEGFEIQIENEESTNNDSIVTKQIPEEGVTINSNGTIILYCE